METTPLSNEEVNKLKRVFPHLPADYWRYLLQFGPGEAPGGWMIYSGPVPPQDIYGDECALESMVIVGDDTQGYCLGFELNEGRLGEVSDSGEWEPWGSGDTFWRFVVADQIVGKEGQITP